MKRAVGYCQNPNCEDFHKSKFLLNPGTATVFKCEHCSQLGTITYEVGFSTGDSDVFREVRVEYNHDPRTDTYLTIAIIRDESLFGPHSTYTLRSPLIRTEKRALKVAESILASLNRTPALLSGIGGDAIPRQTEILMTFDQPLADFSQKLRQLERELQGSPLQRSGW